MDPLTHTLVGAALARTGLGRRTSLAGWALVAGANLPDIDVPTQLMGMDTALLCRRGWTHGVLALVVLPPLLAGILMLAGRAVRRPQAPGVKPRELLLLSYLATLTHPTLDWLNTYGMRWWMPFDGSWSYGDGLYIVDPWVWLTLGGAVWLVGPMGRSRLALWASLATLATLLVLLTAPPAARAVWLLWVLVLLVVRRRHLGPRTARGSERLASLSLAAAALYAALMLGLGMLGRPMVRAELTRLGLGPVGRVMAGPLPANPFAREVVAETPAGYRLGRLEWLPRPRLALDEHVLAPAEPAAVVRAARAAPHVRGFVNWARFPWAQVEEDARGYTVHLLDARYARRRSRGFGTASVRLDRQLRPASAGSQ